jgi:hypothetical protein
MRDQEVIEIEELYAQADRFDAIERMIIAACYDIADAAQAKREAR